MYHVIKFSLKTGGININSSDINNLNNSNSMFNPFNILWRGAKGFVGFLFGGYSHDGMMGYMEKSRFFKPLSKGLLIDGENSRLSEKESFNHMAVFAKSGIGKTTTYIIPNILKLANQDCSMVVTDLSGEIHERTSGYLAKKGFNIHILDPEKVDESMGYNPLYYAMDSKSIDAITTILIKSAYPGEIKASDKFWYDGGKKVLYIFIKVLINTGDFKYINLGNVNQLLNKFGSNGSEIDNFICKYSNEKTFREWRGFVTGHPKTIQSFISVASTALSAISINDDLELLTANHSFDFKRLREQKSIVYIRIPPHRQEQYAFLQNLFYTQLFNSILDRRPEPKELPIYCLLDEFGNTSIPNFSSVVTTIRKYRVSISVVLQDLSQLELRYGKHEADSIINGGISGKMFFTASDLDIASSIEKILGKKYVDRMDTSGKYNTFQEPVMSTAEIRTMKDNEILFIYANKLPMKLETTPYYSSYMMNSKTKNTPCYTHTTHNITYMEYIETNLPDPEEYDPERDGYDYEE
jgi:type IV secretory pathway TraG/TraD family ATPase VirD4